jgi:hypothetical protein
VAAAVIEAAASIHMHRFTRHVIIGHEHQHNLRHLVRRGHAFPGQNGGPVLDDRVPLLALSGVEQRGVNQAPRDGVDAHRG